MRESAGIRRIKRKCESIRFSILSLSLSFIVLLDSWIRIENRQLFESRIIYRESTAVHPIISIIRIFSISKPIDLVRASPTALLDFATSPPPPPLPATSRLLTLELANLSRQPGERKWRVIRVKFKLCRVIFGITPLEGTEINSKRTLFFLTKDFSFSSKPDEFHPVSPRSRHLLCSEYMKAERKRDHMAKRTQTTAKTRERFNLPRRTYYSPPVQVISRFRPRETVEIRSLPGRIHRISLVYRSTLLR